MNFMEIFETELIKYNLSWCKGCELRWSHKRGFVMNDDRSTVHLDRAISTRATLHRALHEIGHCINDESGLRRFEKEQNAETFATKTMREYGISVPRKIIDNGKRYVARKKRHGDNIKKGRMYETEKL